jgi:hypothetical protein
MMQEKNWIFSLTRGGDYALIHLSSKGLGDGLGKQRTET